MTAGLHEEGGSFEPLSRGSSHPEWFAAVASELFDEMDHPDRRGRNLEVAATCFAMLEAAQASAASGRPEPIAP